MTDAQKLEALIDKARLAGWSKWDIWEVGSNPKGYLKAIQLPMNAAAEYEFDVEHILFNHDFARALFGEELISDDYQVQEGKLHPDSLPSWQYHLQQAVIAPNPIDYMYEHAIVRQDVKRVLDNAKNEMTDVLRARLDKAVFGE